MGERDDSEAPYDEQVLWRLIQTLERAAWARRWSDVKHARRALEKVLGKRPHDPLFQIPTGQHMLDDSLNKG
jgi:hypothetical protein